MCGAENAPQESYCYSCGNLLAVGITRPGDTTTLDEDSGPVDPKRRWGTARFDLETILVLLVKGYEGSRFEVRLNHDVVLGRSFGDYKPDVDLGPYEAFERGVSRQHAVLRRQNDTVVLVDMNSANSTFLNGLRLLPEQPRILRDGDEIRLGQLVLRVSFQDVVRKS
jgi:hypothetical protein